MANLRSAEPRRGKSGGVRWNTKEETSPVLTNGTSGIPSSSPPINFLSTLLPFLIEYVVTTRRGIVESSVLRSIIIEQPFRLLTILFAIFPPRILEKSIENGDKDRSSRENILFLLFPISTSLFGSCWRRASLSKEIGLFPSVYRHFRSNGRVGEGGETRVRELQTAFLKDSMISNWANAAQMKFEAAITLLIALILEEKTNSCEKSLRSNLKLIDLADP